MNRENDRRNLSPEARIGLARAVSASHAALEVPPSPDIAALEAAAESLTRFGDTRNAIALWAMALRLRMEVTHAP